MSPTKMTLEAARQTVTALVPGTNAGEMSAEDIKATVSKTIEAAELDGMTLIMLAGFLEDLNREFPVFH